MILLENLVTTSFSTLLESLLHTQIPSDLAHLCQPATHFLYEWKEYWLRLPGCTRLKVGSEWVPPLTGDLFRLRYENQLGLSYIQPYGADGALTSPVCVEVISSKFANFDDHLHFYRNLLDDLFARATRLPFVVSSSTSRGVSEALRPPLPLFVYHFLCQHALTLNWSMSVVQAQPHRQLADQPQQVPLAAASEVDADVLLEIVRSADELVRSQSVAIARRFNGYAPQRIWQRTPIETFDTPENRFVKGFLGAVLAAAEDLPRQSWWKNVPIERKQVVVEISQALRRHLNHALYTEVGSLTRLPLASRVLMGREGYRQLRTLWQIFQDARRPLFEQLREQMEMRSIDQLYEIWCFFALVEEIGMMLGEEPVIELTLSVERGLNHGAVARFGQRHALVYNQPLRGYSGWLHPDFLWQVDGKPEVVLDAKFRLERPDFGEDDETPQARAKREDLYKMHTYRDALGVRAAVVVYPGDENRFYCSSNNLRGGCTLTQLISSNISGVGAISVKPAKVKYDV
jgi:predicted component of viral defense system (DUF524 family)